MKLVSAIMARNEAAPDRYLKQALVEKTEAYEAETLNPSLDKP